MWLVKYFLRHRWKQKTISVFIVACLGSLNLAAFIQSHFCHSASGYVLILSCPNLRFTSGLLPSGVPAAVLYLSLLLIFPVFCMFCPSLNPLCELNTVKLWRFYYAVFFRLSPFTCLFLHLQGHLKNLIYARILPFLWNSKFRTSFVISV